MINVQENGTATSDLFLMSRVKSCARLFQFHVSLPSLRSMTLQRCWMHVCLNIKWRLGSVWWRAAKWPVWNVHETHYMLLSISKLIEMKRDMAFRMGDYTQMIWTHSKNSVKLHLDLWFLQWQLHPPNPPLETTTRCTAFHNISLILKWKLASLFYEELICLLILQRYSQPTILSVYRLLSILYDNITFILWSIYTIIPILCVFLHFEIY